MNPTRDLQEAGRSLWLDSINRTMLREGTVCLARSAAGVGLRHPGSIDTARRLHRQADRPNVLLKISSTPSGRAAIPDADFDNWPTIADTAPVICCSPHRARVGGAALPV